MTIALEIAKQCVDHIMTNANNFGLFETIGWANVEKANWGEVRKNWAEIIEYEIKQSVAIEGVK